MILLSLLLPIHLRRDKINTTLEFSGATNLRKSTMLGEVFHGLQPKRILDLNHWHKVELFQTDILTTMVSLRNLFLMLILLLKKLDKLLLMLKQTLTSGEMEPLQTL